MKLTPTQRALAKFTPEQLAQAHADLDAVVAGPAYHLCRIWLRHRPLYPAPVDYPHWRWIPVGWIANVMKHTFGGYANDFSMALALEHHGVGLRVGKKGHLEADLHEEGVLQALRDRGYHRDRTPLRPWLEFSDFEPAATGKGH